MYEGVEEYSCKYFAERKERQKLVEKGDGPLVRHSYIYYSHIYNTLYIYNIIVIHIFNLYASFRLVIRLS